MRLGKCWSKKLLVDFNYKFVLINRLSLYYKISQVLLYVNNNQRVQRVPFCVNGSLVIGLWIAFSVQPWLGVNTSRYRHGKYLFYGLIWIWTSKMWKDKDDNVAWVKILRGQPFSRGAVEVIVKKKCTIELGAKKVAWTKVVMEMHGKTEKMSLLKIGKRKESAHSPPPQDQMERP